MSESPQTRQRLRQLVERGSLPRTMCSGAFLKLLTPLLSAKIVAWQRSGAGKRLLVMEPRALLQFYQQSFPHAADEVLQVSARVAGVAEYRDSKSLGSTAAEIVVMRGWRNGGLACGGTELDIATPTKNNGAFCFVLRSETAFTLTGRVALVENPAVFLEFERLGTDVPVAIFAHGRISDRLLNWLATQPAENFELIHFGDYDPVGLDEFRRISLRCGRRASIHLPLDLTRLFATYSNRTLVANSRAQRLLAGLRASDNPQIQSVVELIDRHNGGLEQEALLIEVTR
jgi:hypothetical protein